LDYTPPSIQGRRCEDMQSRWFGLGVEAEVMEMMEVMEVMEVMGDDGGDGGDGG
jgi:hypothetical protein